MESCICFEVDHTRTTAVAGACDTAIIYTHTGMCKSQEDDSMICNASPADALDTPADEEQQNIDITKY